MLRRLLIVPVIGLIASCASHASPRDLQADAPGIVSLRDPVRIDFEVLAPDSPSSGERRIGGDVLHVTLVRARARDGAFDACIPEGGRVTIRLTEPNG